MTPRIGMAQKTNVVLIFVWYKIRNKQLWTSQPIAQEVHCYWQFYIFEDPYVIRLAKGHNSKISVFFFFSKALWPLYHYVTAREGTLLYKHQ